MRRNPWILKTPDGKTEFRAFRDVTHNPPSLVVLAGKGELHYRLRCLEDLHEMLKEHGGWMPLGGCGEKERPPAGSVEAWARAPSNPVGGWYGLKEGRRGEFAVYVPPIMEVLNLSEVQHTPQGGRMRAV
jgi:hypothetical protein